jgi:hypothetical protein
MITAILAGLLLLLLGALAKGFLGHILIIFLAWLVKNGLLLGILKTRYGQRVVRHIRQRAYAHAGPGEKRRRVYRVFRRVGRIEAGVTRAAVRLKALAGAVFGPQDPRTRPRSVSGKGKKTPRKG